MTTIKIGAPRVQLEEIVIPVGLFNSKDLNVRELIHRYAVLYKLAEKSNPSVVEETSEKHPSLEDAKLMALVKQAVPGIGKMNTRSSYLFDLNVRTNINEQAIESKSLSYEEKLERIADSIEKFVIISEWEKNKKLIRYDILV